MRIDDMLNTALAITVGFLLVIVWFAIKDGRNYNSYIDKCTNGGNTIVLAGYDKQSSVCVNKDNQIVEVK